MTPTKGTITAEEAKAFALANLEEVKEEHHTARTAVKTSKDAYHQAIRDAVLAGATKSEIARHLGISDARVHQIVNPMLREAGIAVRKVSRGA